MEFSLKNKKGAFPVEVTIDEENYRFTIRNEDTTGTFFNSPSELANWITQNWMKEDFENPEEFEQLMSELQQYR